MTRQRSEGGRHSGALPGLTRRELAGGLRAGPVHATRRFPTAAEFPADVATAWFDLALELVRTTPGYSPPVAARAFGCAGVTLYESLVPGLEGYRSLGGSLPGLTALPGQGANAAYDWPAVANAALASILRSLFPTAPAEQLDAVSRLEESLEGSGPPGVLARSRRRGGEVAAAVFEWSRTEGGDEGYLRNFPPYEPPAGVGLWVPTPPGFLPALQPYWGSNRCLVIRGGGDCPAGDHPPFSEEPGSEFLAEALEVFDTVSHVTPEQLAIAQFWSDDPGVTATPPGHSIAITTQVLRQEAASLATAAEAFARVGMAVSDAFVACWHQKYAYNLLRPVTYLRRLVDPDWLPPLVTPPFPEYTSGHSVQSGAAFQVLTDLFGDGYAFADRTHEWRGLAPRSFSSFFEAADEAAISRLYGGIHFRAAIVNGVEQGRCIGRAASALPLRDA